MCAALALELNTPPEALAKAVAELRETPENREAGVVALRKLIEEDGTLTYATREDVLVRYLRPTKFYPESAFALMKREAEFKKKYCKILEGLLPAMVKEAMLNDAPVNVLRNRDQHGRRVLIQQAGSAWVTAKYPTDLIFQMFYLIHQAAVLEPQTQINGVVVVLDFKGLGLKQIANLTPNFAMLLLTFIQEIMPLRLKGAHIVNEPMLFKAVWNIFKPFIKEKLNKRLFFHGSDMKSLHKHIDASCLPSNYGGKLPAIDYSSKDWYPLLESVQDTIKENNTFGIVPKKK